jgi:DNA-directed RNA polymerase specialized sigma24 family protein
MKEPSQNCRTNENLLWQSLKNASHQAFAETYERYHAIMFGYAMKIHNDPQRVMNVVQEVFIDLWKMRENLADKKDENIKYYLFKAVTRRMNRQLQLAAVIHERVRAGAAFCSPRLFRGKTII